MNVCLFTWCFNLGLNYRVWLPTWVNAKYTMRQFLITIGGSMLDGIIKIINQLR
jgi:hypothetical protein